MSAKSHTKSVPELLIKSVTKKIINILQNGISAKVFISSRHPHIQTSTVSIMDI